MLTFLGGKGTCPNPMEDCLQDSGPSELCALTIFKDFNLYLNKLKDFYK